MNIASFLKLAAIVKRVHFNKEYFILEVSTQGHQVR